MKMHYRIQTILLSQGRSALTLSPVEWVRPVPPIPEHPDDITWEDCEPGDESAEPFEPGGKMTELRVEGAVDWSPGDFLTLTVEATEHNWKP